MQAVSNVLEVLPPRHAAAPRYNDVCDIYIEECSTDGTLRDPCDTRAFGAAPPVGLHASSGERFEQYMNALRFGRLANFEMVNMYFAYGRTKYDPETKIGGYSVLIVTPCLIAVCYELPRTFNGVNPVTEQDADEFVASLKVKLQNNLAEEYEQRQQDMNGRDWLYPRTPSIDFAHSFRWCERSSGWQPARPDDPSCVDGIKVPVLRLEVQNTWAYYRLTQLLEESRDIRVAGCHVPVVGQLWETKDQVRPDLRFRLEDSKLPAAGWVRFDTKAAGVRKPTWTMSHMDFEFHVDDVRTCITRLPNDLTPAPTCVFGHDIECKSGNKHDYELLQAAGLSRFPKAIAPDNNITVIGIVVNTADQRQICVALELDDMRQHKTTVVSEHTVTNYGKTYSFFKFMVQQEQDMLLMFRDILVFYDPDTMVTFNGDGFDWPYMAVRFGDPDKNMQRKRYYHIGRLIASDWTRQTLWGFDTAEGFKPCFDIEKPKHAVRKSFSVWQAGTFDQASCRPEATGRHAGDMLVLIDRCLRGIPEYNFKSLKLDNVAERFLGFHKLDIDLFGNWFGVANATQTLQEQRFDLVRYCVWDAMLPLMVLDIQRIMTYVFKVSEITGARVNDVINRGQLARVGAMFTDVAWSRGYVLSYSMLEKYEYEGAIVLTPQPCSLAGVDPSKACVKPVQPRLDPQYDWSPVVERLDSDEPIPRGTQFSDARNYDPETHTFEADATLPSGEVCGVRVPAQFYNDDYVVTLDFQSLYPSTEKLLNMCRSTVYNRAEPLNRAELCAVRICAAHQNINVEDAVTEAVAARKKQTLNYTVPDGSDEVYNATNGCDGAEDDDDDDEPRALEKDNGSTTDVYVKGDGDRTLDWPPEFSDRFYVVQVSVPYPKDKQNRRKEKRVILFCKPHVRAGIFVAIIDRCLDQRALHKGVMKVLEKKRNEFAPASITDAEIADAQAKVDAFVQSQEPFVPYAVGDPAAIDKSRVLFDVVYEFAQTRKGDVRSNVFAHKMLELLDFIYKLNDITQLAYKLTANSIYGGSGNSMPNSPLASPEVAEATTAVARQKIMYSKDTVLTHFRQMYPDRPLPVDVTEDVDGIVGSVLDVVYGDTDSIFVRLRCRGAKMAIRFAKAIVKYINDKFKEQYGPKCPLNLQAEAAKHYLVLFQRKNYRADQLDNGTEFWKLVEKGVATVRRDRPRVLTDLLSQIYDSISNLGDYSRDVCVLMILRIVWNFMEAMVDNKHDLEMYHVTQRIKKLPSPDQAVKKLAQHIAVAKMVEAKTKVPVRVGDSSTYVLVKHTGMQPEAVPATDVKLEHVDRVIYWEKRMWTNLKKTLVPFIGAAKVDRVFQVYHAALTRQCIDIRAMFDKMPEPECRWRQLTEIVTSTHKYLPGAAVNKKKRKAQSQKRSVCTLDSMFG